MVDIEYFPRNQFWHLCLQKIKAHSFNVYQVAIHLFFHCSEMWKCNILISIPV